MYWCTTACRLAAREIQPNRVRASTNRTSPPRAVPVAMDFDDTRLAQILELFREDNWRRVYAGEREVRPPGAPTRCAHHCAGFRGDQGVQLLVNTSTNRE